MENVSAAAQSFGNGGTSIYWLASNNIPLMLIHHGNGSSSTLKEKQ